MGLALCIKFYDFFILSFISFFYHIEFFIFVLIIAFGVETLLYRYEIVSGVPPALGIAALIGSFWLLRLLVDCFYFSHSDWPKGPVFVIGHALLNSLFIFLALTYWSVLGWHWWLSH